jgi:DNA-directed RNA polymerase subunit RPC12/RpoP
MSNLNSFLQPVKQEYLRSHIHSEEHSVKDEYRCPHCGINFKAFRSLHEHFKTVHNRVKNLFPCYKCKRVYLFHKFILEHKCGANKNYKKRPVIKQLSIVKGEIHKCIRCAEEFHEEDALVCHQHSVCLEDRKYICWTCDQEFENLKILTAHKRTHNRPLICDICGLYAGTCPVICPRLSQQLQKWIIFFIIAERS